MRKLSLVVPLFLVSVFSLTACGESPSDWAPDKVLYAKRDNRETRSWVSVNQIQVQDKDYLIDKAIQKAAPFESVNENKTTSDNYFEYSLDISGSIFPKNCLMTFYEDGYALVKTSNVDFVYSFDIASAKALYETAVAFVATNR